MKLVLDAMGSDTCPLPEVEGALTAARRWDDVHILLVGDESRLQELLSRFGGAHPRVTLVHAADAITMQDKGLTLALKAKRKNSQTSMAIGMELVKRGEADAFVSAGNTGGILSTAYFRLGLLPGVERPGLTALFPVRGGYCVVLDIGANPECAPKHLLQFAAMGSVYAKLALGVANPRVGLISNGEEPGKGNDLVKGAFPLLEASGLNFIGNVEGKELFGGAVDVAVTDGFTGNVVLKSSEAVAKLMTDLLKEHLMRSTRTKLGALLAKPAFDALKKTLDPHEVGAAPLLGVNGLVFIGHGRSNAHAIVSAIHTTRQAVQGHLLEAVGSAIQEQLANLKQRETA